MTVSLIYFQKQLVHRLVYVSKIRQDVNDRKEIGGNYFTLQFSLHTTEYRSEYQIFVSLLSAFKLKLRWLPRVITNIVLTERESENET